MLERRNRLRLRRALILALFLLMPALLSDLSLFAKSGHRPAPGREAPVTGQSGDSADAIRQVLLPLEPGALSVMPGGRHWRTAAGAEGDEPCGGGDQDALLQNLVYLTHARGEEDANLPLSDGFHFGNDSGGHGGGFGSGGGGGGFGGTPHDPGTDFLPLSFGTPDPDNDNGGSGSGGDRPSFLPSGLSSIAAVPEPATWALFILGFGLTGTMLRRARDAGRAPALTRPCNRRLG